MNRYLCLGYYDEAKFEAMDKAELQALVSQCPPLDAELRATGRLQMVASLAASRDSVSLRPRGGRTQVIDGPYAEAKEVLGSFFIIEAADIAEAIAIASKHPAAQLGETVGWAVEIRPIEYCRALEQAAAA
ncbi:MAG TPA: YciI family protein [Solimonas sp.]|nr:YciI family protein [Solimonas sp.]